MIGLPDGKDGTAVRPPGRPTEESPAGVIQIRLADEVAKQAERNPMNQDPNFPSHRPPEHPTLTAAAEPPSDPAQRTAASTTQPAPVQRADSPDSAAPGRLSLPPIRQGLPFDERCQEAMNVAQEAFAQTGSWVVFYREILGAEGTVRKLFPTTEDMRRFEETATFGNLLEMAAALRSQDTGKGDEFEPQKMITVRLPKSQHETLKVEAAEHGTSINKLCISKLLLPIESRFVPVEKGKVRGRKPGPQGSRNQRLPETEKAQ